MHSSKFYTLKKKDLENFLSSVARSMDVHVPVSDGRDFNFAPLAKGMKIDLSGYVNTSRPPRELLLPEGETLLEYDEKKVSERFENRKQAIFGMRPCDVHAVIALDRALIGHDHVEGHYEKRRNNTIIMALRCERAGKNCFCESMGTSDVDDAFDLMFTESGSSYHVEAGSPDGMDLIRKSRLFTMTDKEASKKKLRCQKSIDTENLSVILKRAEKSRLWHDVAERCLSCASCTFSCPTCFCFSMVHDADISDLKKGKVGREMDYCMLMRFSRISGNFVFRQHRTERFRQFFYHKFLYGLENEGVYHCVGCGRCITECMAKIDITEEAAKVRKRYGK